MSDVNFNVTTHQAGTGGGGSLEVQEAGASIATGVTVMNFESGATVTDMGGGEVQVDVTGGGGGTGIPPAFYTHTMTGDFFQVTAAFSNTAGGGMVQVGSVQVDNVVIHSIRDVISLNFSALAVPSATADLLLGYQIGSNDAIWGTYSKVATTLTALLAAETSGITPGTYTVKLMAAKSGTGTVDIGASDSTTYGDGNIPAGAIFSVKVTSAGSTAGINGLVEALTFTADGSAVNVTSSSFIDVSGMVTQNFDAPVDGDYLILVSSTIYASTTAYAQDELAVVIDGGSALPLIGKMDYQVNIHMQATRFVKTTLTAGTHSIKPQWRLANATGKINADSDLKWGISIINTGLSADARSDVEDLSWTPTGSWSTNTTYAAKAQIIGGNRLVAKILMSFSGAPDAGDLTINMPAGWEIDPITPRASVGVAGAEIGTGYQFVNGGYALSCLVLDVSTIALYDKEKSGSNALFGAGGPITKTFPSTVSAGEKFSITIDCFVVPA